MESLDGGGEGMTKDSEDVEIEVDALLADFKREGHRNAVEVFERFRSEIVTAGIRARAPAAERKLSPFVYQLR